MDANNNIKVISILSEHIKDRKYKTEMCKNWEKNGTCPYNSKCRFAHGRFEIMLKEADSNPNYKAKDCLNFFTFGHCSYGRRCCFKHDERRFDEENLEAEFMVMIKHVSPLERTRLSVFSEITHPTNKTYRKQASDENNSLDTTVEEEELLKAVGREILNELNELEC